MSGWEPLPDPRKPPLPYDKDLVLTIKRHAPPEPFGLGYNHDSGRQRGQRSVYGKLPLTEWCLQSPPKDTPAHKDSTQHQLRVIEQIACRDGRGSQVLGCNLGKDDKKVYVAKIYDPLYYQWEPWGCGEPDDPTFQSESDYSREAAAYEEVEKAGFNGVFTPTYFGSWTFEMPLLGSPKITRPVRMILTEWIPGVSMWALIKNEHVEKIPPKQRFDILAKALEYDSALAFAGVEQYDFAPRNVLLAGSHIETRMPKVYLIDFAWSVVTGHPHASHHPPKYNLPLNPRYRFWRGSALDLMPWLPMPHQCDTAAFKGWLMTQWGDDSEGFAAVPDEFKERWGLIGDFQIIPIESEWF